MRSLPKQEKLILLRMSGNRQPDILCQEHIYRRLTDGRHRPPVLLSEQTVCLPQTHDQYASNASSVYLRCIVRFAGVNQ